MKRTEQREHIFKLIFGADFNEESEQGTQTELYLEQIEGATEKDMQYISQKAQKIIEKIDEIDTFRQVLRSTKLSILQRNTAVKTVHHL